MMKQDTRAGDRILRNLPWQTAALAAALAFNTGARAQVVLSEDFTGGMSTTGFTVADTASDCSWIYAPGGLTPGAFSQDAAGSLPTGAGFDGDFAFLDADECGGSGIAVNSYLVSSTFDASAAGNYILTFSQQFRARLQSFARVEVFNGTTWSQVANYTGTDVGYPNPAVTSSVNITSAAGGSAAAQIRFQFSAGWDWWWAVDNILIERVNCAAPEGLAVTGLTTSGGVIGWTDNGSSGYEWAVTSGAVPDGTNALANGDGTDMTIAGLQSGTFYTAYVRSDCGDGTFSNWSNGFAFTTGISNDECIGAIALTVNPNYDCGTVTSGTVAGATASGDSSTCGGTADDDVWFLFTASDTLHRISLSNIAGSVTDMYMALWTGSCGNLTLVPGSCSDANTLNIGGLTPGNVYYLQVYTYTATAGQNSTFDVCVGSEPFCQPPLAIALDSISAPDAYVSWTDNTASEYQYELRLSGAAGSGATGLVDAGMVAGSPLSLTGLVADSLYILYVRSICSVGDTSAWSSGLDILDGYCASNFTSVSFEFITNVAFSGIDNTSAGTIGGPVNYAEQIAQVMQGGIDTLSVTIDADALDYVYAFIDWNQNSTLDDAGEVYTLATSVDLPGPHTLAIPIPMDAALGQTKMRVMVDYSNDIPDPCRNATFGEAEDYTVEVYGNVDVADCEGVLGGPAMPGTPCVSSNNFGGIWSDNCICVENVGIEEIAAKTGIAVHPNPASTELFITTPDGKPVHVKVYDMIGHLALEQDMITKLDITDLATGSYSLVIINENGTAQAHARFMKQ